MHNTKAVGNLFSGCLFQWTATFGFLLGYRSTSHSIKKYLYSLLETCSPRHTVCTSLPALTCQSFWSFARRWSYWAGWIMDSPAVTELCRGQRWNVGWLAICSLWDEGEFFLFVQWSAHFTWTCEPKLYGMDWYRNRMLLTLFISIHVCIFSILFSCIMTSDTTVDAYRLARRASKCLTCLRKSYVHIWHEKWVDSYLMEWKTRERVSSSKLENSSRHLPFIERGRDSRHA